MITQTDIADLAVLVLGVCAAKWQACVREADGHACVPPRELLALRGHGCRPAGASGWPPPRFGASDPFSCAGAAGNGS
jgi:hypothetical protein